MKYRIGITVVSIIGALVMTACAATAAPPPSQPFTLSPSTLHEGDTITMTFGHPSHVARNDETTAAFQCFMSDGTFLLWPNYTPPSGGSQATYEFNTFGGFPEGYSVHLQIPFDATRDYSWCLAQYSEIHWKNGVPVQAWSLSPPTYFYPLP